MAKTAKSSVSFMVFSALLFIILIGFAAYFYRDDIFQSLQDPGVPFQTYTKPPAPDYTQDSAWLSRPDITADSFLADAPGDAFIVVPGVYPWSGRRSRHAPIAGFFSKQTGAQCEDGLLLVDKPRSRSLRRPLGISARFWTLPSNLFFEDLRLNARERTRALLATGRLPTRVRALDSLDVIEVIESPVTPFDPRNKDDE